MFETKLHLSSIYILIIYLINFSFPETKNTYNADELWSYDNQTDWSTHFKACDGKHESPVNIDTTKVRIDSKLKLKFHNYEKLFQKTTAQNNGHTVRVFLHLNHNNYMPYISGEAVRNQKFILDSFHFHWGDNEYNGSEHSINNVKKSGELHLVHWNSIYGNISNARDREEGLLVVTVFIETKIITDFGVIKAVAHNEVLTPVIKSLKHIERVRTHTRINTGIHLKSLLPAFDKLDLFYVYSGSLTTPPCSETATFVIFSNPIYFSSDQLSKFRRIRGEAIEGVAKPLLHNIRQQKKLNDRIVFVSNPFAENTELIN